jgi:hypothetical protein
MSKNSKFGPVRGFLLKRSTVLFGALSLGLVIIKVGLQFLLTDLPLRDQAAAFTWPLVLSIIAIGFLGLLADRASGFPDSLSDPQRDRRGIVIATITGLSLALINRLNVSALFQP